MRRRSQNTFAAPLLLHGALAVVAMSLLMAGLVSVLNQAEAPWSTYLLAGYALTALAAGSALRQKTVSAAGAIFAAAALGNGLYFGAILTHLATVPRLALAACGYGTLMLVWRVGEVLWALRRGEVAQKRREVGHPLALAAMLVTVLVIPLAWYLGSFEITAALPYLLWVCGAWLALLLLHPAALALFAFRAVATLTAGYAAVAVTQRIYPQLDSLWNSTQLLSMAIALAAMSVMWMLLEAARLQWSKLAQLLRGAEEGGRELFHYLALIAMVTTACALAGKGITAELDLGSWHAVGPAVLPVTHAAGFWLAWTLFSAALAGRWGLDRRFPQPAEPLATDSLRTKHIASDDSLPRLPAFMGLVIASALFPLVRALHAEPSLAVATALRWCYALYGLLGAGFVLGLLARQQHEESPALAATLSDPLMAIAAVPVCGITLLAFWAILAENPPVGPLPESWLARIPAFASYIVPLAMIVGTMVLHGVALGRSRNVAMGSVVLQAALSLACCLATYLSGKAFDTPFVIDLWQVNAIALPLYGLLWYGLSRKWLREESDSLLQGQVATALAVASGLLMWIVAYMAFVPTMNEPALASLIAWPSWLAIGLTLPLTWLAWRQRTLGQQPLFYWAAVALLVLTAGTLGSLYPSLGSGLLGPQVLQIGLLITAYVAAAGVTYSTGQQRVIHEAVCVGAVLLALAFAGRCLLIDAFAPHWQVGVIGVSLLPLSWLGLVRRQQVYAYSTTLLAALIPGTIFWASPTGATFWLTCYWSLTAGALMAFGWGLLEIWYQRRRGTSLDERMPLAVHRLYSCLLLPALAFIAAAHTVLVGGPTTLSDGLATGSCLAAFTLLTVASMWDRTARYPFQFVHMAGGAWIAWGLGITEFPYELYLLACAVAATVYHTLLAWISRRGLWMAAQSLHVPNLEQRRSGYRAWLLTVATLSGAVVLAICFFGVLGFRERWAAMLCGLTPALMALEVLLLIDSPARTRLRGLGLLMAVLAAVLLSWADLHGSGFYAADAWLMRMIRTVIITAALGFLFGVVGARRLTATNPWRAVLARGAIGSMATAVALLLPILASEVSLFERGSGLPIDDLHSSAVALSLLGILITLVVFALSKGLDPLELGESQKQLYIYAAEGVLVLIAGQIYLMRPELFGGAFRQYWPLILMVVAFVGVGVSELAHRSGQRVLAEPFYHTSLLLPVLPAVGLWLVDSNVSYALLMFAAGALYTVLALARRSPLSTLAAVVSGNIGLWALMSEGGWEFMAHPQFWLIPPAASVLLAAQYQREKLGEGQLAAIRYGCMLVIYLSSVAEVFTQGLGQSLWPPMLLATLAVAGALAGVAFRIRAFLYTGTCFLAFAMFSMVWHAYEALEHAAVWWVFGITLGLTILLLFALFEKNREQLQGWIREMQKWEK